MEKDKVNGVRVIVESGDDSKNDSTATIPIEDHEATPLKNGTNLDMLEVKFATADKDSILSSRTSMDVEVAEEKPKIPDGGWGWVVVLSSLVISMVADGISFSFGLLYIEFLKEFKASKATTSWIGSLFMAVPLLTGPIMSALVDKYGCRSMTILGGIISGIGFVLSAFVDNIIYMLITFGVIAGLGLGLCYVTAVVSIAFWFDKKRTLAVGLGACGTGIGTFVYAPMTQFFIETYAWRGTVLLLAGTFFNMCVCGALMRAPAWWIKEQKKINEMKFGKKLPSSTSVSCKSPVEEFPDVEEIRKLLTSSKQDEYLLQTLVTFMESNQGDKSKHHHRSDFNLPTFIKQDETVPLEVLEQLKANKKLYNVILENYPSLLTCRSTSEKGLDQISEIPTTRVPVTFSMKLKKTRTPPNTKTLIHQQSLPVETLHEPLLTHKASVDEKPWLKRQFSSTNYYKNIRLHRNSIVYRGAMLNIKKYHLRASSCPNIYKNSMTTLAKEDTEKWYQEFLELFKGMMDFSLFLELHFLLMSLSTILLFTFFIVPYFYLAEHMTRIGYTEEEASFVLSFIGIANTIGMIFLGWAGDQPWMNVTKTYAVCLVCCGLSTAGIMFLTSQYNWLLVAGVCFGLSFASTFSFTPVILVELVPLERFTTAYGLILLCQGIGNLLGPPIGGLIFDLSGKWEQSFYQAGIWIVVSGILIAIIPMTKNRKIFGTGPVEKELAASEKGSCA